MERVGWITPRHCNVPCTVKLIMAMIVNNKRRPKERTAIRPGLSSGDLLDEDRDCSGAKRRATNDAAKDEIEHLARVAPLQPENAIEDITGHKQAEGILNDERERLRLTVDPGVLELQESVESLRAEALVRAKTQTALHESEIKLLKGREELRALTGSLFTAQDDERRSVSTELHDDLSQKTAKLQFDVETLEQDLAPGLKDVSLRLFALRDQIATLSNDLREMAYRLHPSTLDHLGLTVALRAYCKDFSKREGVEVQLSARNVPTRIAAPIASCFYRVAQEALRNVTEHAGDATVQIRLSGNSKQLVLSIRDNGIGFDNSLVRSKNALGLVSIEERVRLIHGELSLQTKPGHGVVIKIKVLIEPNATE
jgi:two-component system NarL family sensor kinase